MADHPAVLVGMRAQGHVLVLAGDQVEDLHAVPTRPHLVVAEHPHLQVGADPAVVAQGQPGLVGQGRVGPDPEPEHDQVGLHDPVGGADRPDPAVAVGVEAGDGGVGVDVDAELLHRLVHQLAHVGIERAHGLGGLVDHGYRHLPAGQGLGHLHPDVAAAHHHGPPRPEPFQAGQQRGAVVQGLDTEDPDGVTAGKGRSHRHGAGGQDQVVEALPVAAAGGQVTHRHRPGLEVDRLHVGEHAQVDAVGPMRLRCPGDQPLPVGDVAGHPVGDAAGRIGAVGPTLEGDHLELVAGQPLGLGGRAHPGGIAADDHHPLGHACHRLDASATSQTGEVSLWVSRVRRWCGSRCRPAPPW